MFKGSGIGKSNKRKWNASLDMEPKEANLNNGCASRSVADDVEEDVHFVINSDFNITTSISNRKSIELPRKTYSKKNPINALPNRKSIELPHKTYSKKNPLLMHPYMSSDMLDPFRDSLAAKDRLQSPLTLKCTPAVTASESKASKKQKRDTESLTVSRTLLPRKFQKRNPAQSCNGKVPRIPRSRSVGSRPISNEDGSSDSDIEIVAEYTKTVVSTARVASMKKLANGQAQLVNKRNGRGFESSVGSQVVEADIAPFMPANPTVYPDTGSRANSMRWLSASGEMSVTSIESNGVIGNGASHSKTANSGKKPMFLPELKSQINEKPKGKRELQRLYDNLNEISWAHETSFKNLLRNPDATKGKGRINKTGKNLRNLQPKLKLEILSGKRAAKVKASQLMARKKSKMARLNQKDKAAQKNKSTVMETMRKKKLGKQVVNTVAKKNGIAKSNLNLSKKEIESDTNEETDILYSLPGTPKVKVEKPDTKPKINVGKTKVDSQKIKNASLKIKSEVPKLKPSMLKLKSEAQKTKSNIYKLKPDALKQKSNVFKLKPDGQKTKTSLLKLKPDDSVGKSFVTQVKPEHSPPSTSGLQNGSFHSKSTSNSKNSDVKDFLKTIEGNLEVSQEVQLLQGLFDQNEHLYSAVQKGSKLRVSLQPLEQTNLWTSEFYDDFRRHFLDQALRKAKENRDRDSIAVMYQELLESLESARAAASNGGRAAKRRRLGNDEEALRSSVRQCEGAFRYKEIVVKKRQNYMQVVLVPNNVKQNCLTVEAMKELKDAFLLAKKDPHCKAVLLNSSGKYFCTGLDLSPLVGVNKDQVASIISNSMRDLVLTLSTFTKPVIAAVNGSAIGFGVSLLTYCDVVLASDKATFCLPANKIGYMPEGGITLTLPQLVGSAVASDMLMQGRRLTAEQAFRFGLVSEVLWPTSFMNDVIPRMKTIVSQPLPAMEATKAMVRYHLWDKLKSHMDRECRLLCEHWMLPQCQANIKALLQTGWTYGE